MNRSIIFLLIISNFFFLDKLQGQDLHFSQSFNQPYLFNPSQAGLMPTEDYRLATQYRSQWGNLPVPYKTIGASGDLKVLANDYRKGWLGLGLGLYNDKAGYGDLSLTKAQFSTAYHVEINESFILSAGIGLGVVQRSVNMAQLTFDNQWNGLQFDKDLPQGEVYTHEKVTYFDASLGLSLSYTPSEEFYFQFAAGVMHVNQPNESFYEKENRIGIRPVVDLRNVIKISDNWIGEWGIHASQQQLAYEIVGGGQVSTNVSPRELNANVLIAGIYYRWMDAAIPMVGYEWNGIRLLVSSDIPISPLSAPLKGYGGVEVSLVFKGLYEGGFIKGNGRKSYGCPRF